MLIALREFFLFCQADKRVFHGKPFRVFLIHPGIRVGEVHLRLCHPPLG